MVSKTREKLIDVARQLFAKNGIENTTMNDIANASDKGRRTIYTYFKNKRDIYNAVIERESENLVTTLRTIASSSQTPADKLASFIRRRLEVVGGSERQESLKSFFTFEYKRLGRVRKLATAKVNEIFSLIINEGVSDGSFDEGQARRLSPVVTAILHGYYSLHINEPTDEVNIADPKSHDAIIEFILNGIKSSNNVY